jgi:1-acyl-sn-glycerol-3-phosphate acyltransferase
MQMTTTNKPIVPIIPIFNENSSTLQTFLGGVTVTTFIAIWISSLMSPILLYISIQTQNYLAAGLILSLTTIAYLPWDTKGKLPQAVKHFIKSFHPMYYTRCKVLFEDTLPKADSKPTFYAVHPHGAFCLGWAILFASDFMENVRFCFAPGLYYSPFFRIFSLMVGTPGKADKKAMVSYMKEGKHLALPPGGFEEATITSTIQDRVFIKKRAGFVKLCLQHGYSIVPVYCFGENETYFNMQGFWRLRLKMNSLSVPAILIWGSRFLPLLPKRSRHGLVIVAGKRLDVPKIENPTREDVKLWHDKYMAALLKIFEDHKYEAYGDDAKTMKLELW